MSKKETRVNKVGATPAPPENGEVSWQTGEDHSGKRRSPMYHQLTESERYTLSVLHRDGQSLRAIARILERSPSTISREVRRNRCHRTDGAYRPSKAQERTNGRRRKRTSGPERRGKLQGKPMIDTRPVEVENRVEVGHWEGDTVIGTVGERDCLLTLVERSTGLAVVTKLPHRTVKAVNRAAVEAIERCGLPFKTITWDNGTEFHGYRATASRINSTHDRESDIATRPRSNAYTKSQGCCTWGVNSPACDRPRRSCPSTA